MSSNITRLYGVELTPVRLNVHIPEYDKTGFQIGSEMGFSGLGIRNGDGLVKHLGIKPCSDEYYEFVDNVKSGFPDIISFLHDVLAGVEHANSLKKLFYTSVTELKTLAYHMAKKVAPSEMVVYLDFDLENPENLNFQVSYRVEGEKEFSRGVLRDILLKSDSLIQLTEEGVKVPGLGTLDLSEDSQVFNEEFCHGMWTVFKALSNTLCDRLIDIQFEEFLAVKKEELREQLKASFYSDTTPNVFLK